jgi:hypothetical protein
MRTLKGAATRSAPHSQQHRTSFTEYLPSCIYGEQIPGEQRTFKFKLKKGPEL